jgi:tripartite-type tricarboxylate transporter receptor subunit TctC
LAPARTPKDIVGKLNGEVVRLLRTPTVAERIMREGATPVGSTPEQFSERLRNEIAKWAKVAKQAGLTTAR